MYSNKRKKLARTLAIILVIGMIVMSMSYLFMLFGNSSAIGYTVYAADAKDTTKEKAEDRLEYLHSVIDYIYENYKDKITYEELVNAAFNGVFNSLDRWSEYYFDGDGADALSNALDNNYCGVGLTMQMDEDGFIRIISVNKEGPAFAAGITAGGTVEKVDGVSAKELGINEVANRIRGAEGSKVTVTIRNNGVEKTYTLVRTKLIAPTLQYELLEGKIGYIVLDSFSVSSAIEVAAAKADLLSQGAKSFILDLRYNGGGYLDVAIEIADLFMDKGPIVYLEQQGKIIETINATPDDGKKTPLVVIVNEQSASASEVLALALQESGTAKVVGVTSYGKGIGQQITSVVNGDSLKLSEIYMLGPKKTKYHEIGVKPDYVVYQAYDYDIIQLADILLGMIPLDLKQRYFVGQYGLNVLAAQERLEVLGYDVERTARMDAKTIEALKVIQKNAGGIPYGGLDYFTLSALDKAYEAAVSGSTEDLQLKKAVELLK